MLIVADHWALSTWGALVVLQQFLHRRCALSFALGGNTQLQFAPGDTVALQCAAHGLMAGGVDDRQLNQLFRKQAQQPVSPVFRIFGEPNHSELRAPTAIGQIADGLRPALLAVRTLLETLQEAALRTFSTVRTVQPYASATCWSDQPGLPTSTTWCRFRARRAYSLRPLSRLTASSQALRSPSVRLTTNIFMLHPKMVRLPEHSTPRLGAGGPNGRKMLATDLILAHVV